MRRLKILALSCIVLAATSCKEYLDVRPYGRTIPKTAEEFSALIHTHLNDLDNGSSNYFVGNAGTLMDWDTGGGDDFEVCLTENSGKSMDIYLGSFVGSMSAYSIYSSLYEVIRDCNIVIDNLEDDDDQLTKDVLATSYALRAVCYYQLLRMYCEAPRKGEMAEQLGLALVTTFDMEERPVRSNMLSTIDLIESDLKKAIGYQCTNDLYRFTADVAKGYLARLYFWTEQWDKVLPLTSELLQTYPILDRDAFKEMMNSPFVLGKNQLIKAYRTYTSSTGTDFSSASGIIKYRPVSVRFLSHFNTAAGEDSTDVRYSMSVNRKRRCQKSFFCGMRSAEFKLMEAECYYHLGQESEALASLNDLRRHRIRNATDYTMQTLPAINSKEIISVDAEGNALTPLIAAILSERRKELFLEGDRLFEQKRNGTPEFWTAYNGRRYNTLAYMYTFPIPESDIRIISALQQNPGYTEVESD